MILESIDITRPNAFFLGKTSGAFPECSDNLRHKSGNGSRLDGSCSDPSCQGSLDARIADIPFAVIALLVPSLNLQDVLNKELVRQGLTSLALAQLLVEFRTSLGFRGNQFRLRWTHLPGFESTELKGEK